MRNKRIILLPSKHFASLLWFIALSVAFISCKQKALPNQDMIDLLKSAEKFDYNADNVFSPAAVMERCNSVINNSPDKNLVTDALIKKANALLQLGEEQKAIDVLNDVFAKIPPFNFEQRESVKKAMAVTYLRLGERTNCIHNHTAESCIYPIATVSYTHLTLPTKRIV